MRLTSGSRKWRAFAEFYPEAISIEPDPSKLRELVNERLRLLDAAAHLNTRLADVEMRAQELSPRHEALMAVERRCNLEGTGKSLPERVQAAIAAVRAHNQAYDDF
ncbi:MAG: hypothetical protein IPG56_10315 [Caulobacteraceae bacterium]|nr:hypothetical protein [Caulobacteraceae bacterium]